MKARLTFVSGGRDEHGLPVPGVRAQAKVGNKTITATGRSDAGALKALREKVAQYEVIQDLKALYPKEVEL